VVKNGLQSALVRRFQVLLLNNLRWQCWIEALVDIAVRDIQRLISEQIYIAEKMGDGVLSVAAAVKSKLILERIMPNKAHSMTGNVKAAFPQQKGFRKTHQ
jgi:hypothetical protein